MILLTGFKKEDLLLNAFFAFFGFINLLNLFIITLACSVLLGNNRQIVKLQRRFTIQSRQMMVGRMRLNVCLQVRL